MERFLWICLAGAFGTGLRYLVGQWASVRLGTALPYGTLIVNVVGCLLIAVIAKSALNVVAFPATLRLALTVGFLGGLTTYSSFAYESVQLAAEGARGAALLNFALTTGGCFAAVLIGVAIADAATR